MCKSAVKNTCEQITILSENDCDNPSKVSPSQQTAISDVKQNLMKRSYMNLISLLY